jgi:branched-subunit amino acid ABC-type transport system permease component
MFITLLFRHRICRKRRGGSSCFYKDLVETEDPSPHWKSAVGFAILIPTLLVLPRGIFGRKRARM